MAQVALLTSATRKATTNCDDVIGALADPGRGLMLMLDVTATPDNSETLTLAIQAKDVATDKYQTITAFTALTASDIGATSTTDTYVYTLYPGAAETATTANHEVQALPVPQIWRAVLTHSSTGSWAYTLSYETVQ